MFKDETYCPHCKCTAHVHVDASGSEWASLIINECGSVRLSVCLNCGTVYLDQIHVRSIRERRERIRKDQIIRFDRWEEAKDHA